MISIYIDIVSSGGMPEMIFEYILRQNKIDPETDLTIDQSIDFALQQPLFLVEKVISLWNLNLELPPM